MNVAPGMNFRPAPLLRIWAYADHPAVTCRPDTPTPLDRTLFSAGRDSDISRAKRCSVIELRSGRYYLTQDPRAPLHVIDIDALAPPERIQVRRCAVEGRAVGAQVLDRLAQYTPTATLSPTGTPQSELFEFVNGDWLVMRP